jgi:hypothetical protein
MMPARFAKRWLRLLLLGLPLLAMSCVNPFTPAEPEPPDSSGVIEDYSTTDRLLFTMQLALASKTAGGTNAWLHAFAESTVATDNAYRAFYDPGVKASWLSDPRNTAPEPWDLRLERNLPTELSKVLLTYEFSFEWARDPFSPIDEDPGASTTIPPTVLFHRHYTLKATSPDGQLTDTLAIGYADLSLQRTARGWSIFRWEDRVDPVIGVLPASPDQHTMSWHRLNSLSR